MSPDPSFTGLDTAEAARRLEEDGPNLLTADRTRPLWKIVAGALREPMFLLLAAATALYLGLGDLAEGVGELDAVRKQRPYRTQLLRNHSEIAIHLVRDIVQIGIPNQGTVLDR